MPLGTPSSLGLKFLLSWAEGGQKEQLSVLKTVSTESHRRFWVGHVQWWIKAGRGSCGEAGG